MTFVRRAVGFGFWEMMMVFFVMPAVSVSEVLDMYVIEESPLHTFVGSVVSHFTQGLAPSVANSFRYGFWSQPNQDASLFQLDPIQGALRTAKVINREEYCPGQVECYVEVDVMITEPLDPVRVVTTRVYIRDVNDNPPAFPESQYRAYFSELSPVGSQVNLPIPLDDDSPAYGVDPGAFHLINGPPTFDLVPSSSGDLVLKLMMPLDREELDEYHVTVIAADAGNPSLSGSLEVIITVEDANDHAPVFNNSTYVVEVRENFDLGPGFFTAQASDLDAGPNGRISYKFAARTQSHYGRQFGIRPGSGEVYLKAHLDWRRKRDYHLDLVATDGGPRPMSTQCTLHVKVIDVNDNAPVVSIFSLGNSSGEVKENSPPNTLLVIVSVFDNDDGDNGAIECDLNRDEFLLEPFEANKYRLQTARELDRELTQFYDIEIRCHDRGIPSLSSTRTINVVVVDENDHQPTFSQRSYSTVFLENNDPDEYIMQLNATDPDQGDNGRLSYEIVENMNAFVYIQPDGTIRASQALDRERNATLNFNVQVRDHGSPPRTSRTNVTITIWDENDEAPVIQTQRYPFSVRENLPAHQRVGQMNASDQDSDLYNLFTFSLIQLESPGVFTIDRQTGVITTTKVLDREMKEEYQLVVVATDTDSPTLSSTTVITVKILDDNDNFPTFKYPRSDNNTFSVSNLVPPGHGIFKATAVDMDADLNGQVSYGIASGNEDHLFAIDSESGVVSTKVSFETVNYEEHELTLFAVDNGRQTKNTSMIIRIHIDQNAPYHLAADNEGLVRSNNLIIIIVVAAVSGFIMVILIIAIAAMKCYDRRRPTSVYKCRVEEQKILRQVALEGRQASHDSLRSNASSKSCGNRMTPPEQMPSKRTPDWNRDEHGAGSREGTWGSGGHGGDSYNANTGPEQHLEAHLLALLKKDRADSGSASSTEMSTADSGRGPSEEGDQGYHSATRLGYQANHGFGGKTHSLGHSKGHGANLKSPGDIPSYRDAPHTASSPVTTTTAVVTHPIPAARPAQRVNPPLRGSLHYLLKEEEDRRGRHQRKPLSNPKQSLTTFHASPPSYESVVGEDDESSQSLTGTAGSHGNTTNNLGDSSQSEALLQNHLNGLHNIAEEECLSDGLGSDHSDNVNAHEVDGRFFKSVVV